MVEMMDRHIEYPCAPVELPPQDRIPEFNFSYYWLLHKQVAVPYLRRDFHPVGPQDLKHCRERDRARLTHPG